jgi:uncharacterized membrane protein YidH (DUF202 family)
MPVETFANERTALGWQRSALSLAVIAALVFLHALHRHEPLGMVASALPAAGAAWTQRRGRRIYGERARERYGPAPGSLRVLALLTAGAALLAAAVVAGGS